MAIAAGKTAGWVRIGDVCIYISAKRPPSDADWNAYLAWLRENGKPSVTRPELLSLVYDRSPGPNASQRKQLNDSTVGWKMRVAVLSPSTVARGIVTAMNWFKKDAYEAFPPDDFERALTFLGAPAQIRPDITIATKDLAAELDAQG